MDHRNKSGDDNDGEPYLTEQQRNEFGNDGVCVKSKMKKPGLLPAFVLLFANVCVFALRTMHWR
jgi:hypothetical protein